MNKNEIMVIIGIIITMLAVAVIVTIVNMEGSLTTDAFVNVIQIARNLFNVN